MKVAFIVPYVPNQVRTRSYNLITYLSRLGHEVDVFTVGSGDVDRADAQALWSRCRAVYFYEQPVWRSLFNSALAVPSKTPLQAVYSRQPDLIHRLDDIFGGDEMSSGYEVVHVEHLRGSEYGKFLKNRFPGMPVVWDSVDCISHLFRQAAGQSTSLFGKLVSRFELGRTEKTEADLLEIFDHVLVTSGIDRDALLETVRDGKTPAPISVLPNGVDQEYFKPNPDIPKEPETLVFSGKMSYHANISMVKYLVNEIMPLIWLRRPHVRLLVVGKDPSPEIKRMAENPLIEVTGTVPDIRPFLWKSTIAVAPLVYGAGIQNKILEAMAVGLPVVTTSKALLSLGAAPGRNVLTGDTADEFSASVLRLLDNPEWGHHVGEAGRLFVWDNHDWGRISEQLVEIYRSAAFPERAGIPQISAR
jgi:glycosyltransferase involved in cell wall biosynthesis